MRITSSDRAVDRRNGKRASGSTWGHGSRSHGGEHITASDRAVDRRNGKAAAGHHAHLAKAHEHLARAAMHLSHAAAVKDGKKAARSAGWR